VSAHTEAADFDVIVIGEGMAGLTVANSLARTGLRTASFEAEMFGGLVVSVIALEPAPGGRQASGSELAGELFMDNTDLGVQSIQQHVDALRPDGDGRFIVATADARYRAAQVIVASGARLRTLDVPGEADFVGRGVSRCADCDGPLFTGTEVVVVGGGDSALQEALILAAHCSKVHVVHRDAQLSARQEFVTRVRATACIEVLDRSVVQRIEGKDGVEQVQLRSLATGEVRALPCAGVFPFVGLVPNADFVPPEVERDEHGCLRTTGRFESSVRGLWAVGAVRHGHAGTLEAAVADARACAEAVAARLGRRIG